MAKKRKKAPKKRSKKQTKKAAKTEGVDAAAVREYYEKHGWRPTLSKFGLSTTEASSMIKGSKTKTKKKKAKKAKKKTGKKKENDAAPKKRGRKPGKKRGKKKAKKTDDVIDVAAVREYHEKHGWRKTLKKFKLGTKQASAILNGGKTKAKKSKKKRGKKKAAKRQASQPKTVVGSEADVLDWLLAYREKHQKAGHMMTLDTVVIDLMTQLRTG